MEMRAQKRPSGDPGELFKLLARNAKDEAIFMIDAAGQVLTWNIGAQNLLGYDEAEIVGRNCDCFFTPEDRQSGLPVQELEQARLNSGHLAERWQVRKDRSTFWASSSTTPLADEQGKLHGFVKIMRDRSEAKRTEEALARQMTENQWKLRLYEAALSSTPDLVYVFDLDHRFAYANQALLATWGRTWDEAIGKTCLELGYEVWHAEMHDREIELVIETRQPIQGEVPYTGTAGLRIYEYIFVPVIGEDGQVKAVAGTTRDVTVRRNAESLVRSSEERFRSLMEQAPFSVQLFSPDGRTVSVNQAWEELWGLKLEQLAEYNILNDPQLEAKGVLAYIRRGFAGEAVQVPAIEYNPNETLGDVTKYEDPTRWLSAVIYPLKNDDGQVREVVLIHQDITGRHRAEEALQKAHRELESRVAQRTSELVQANEFMKALLENVQTGIVACDADGELTLFNTVTRQLHGKSQEPLASAHWATQYSLLHADGRTPMAPAEVPLYRALAGERVRDVEMVIAPHGMPSKTVLASGQAFYDAQGAKLGAVVSMHDVTERKAAEAALRKVHEELERRVAQRTEQLLHANEALQEANHSKDLLLTNLRQAAIAQEQLNNMLREQAGSLAAILSATVDHIYLMDDKGRYRYVSDGGASVLGLRPTDMTGKHWRELNLPASVMEQFDAQREWVLKHSQPKREQLTFTTRTGQRLHYEYTVAPVQSEEGRTVAVVVVSRDDTLRKQSEEALAESEAQFRVLTEAMPQLVWTSLPDGSIDYVNQRWLAYTGMHIDEVVGSGWVKALHADDVLAMTTAWQRSVETGTEYNVEQRLRNRNGQYRWFLTRALPLRGEGEQVIKWFGTCTDIEVQKRANDALRDADRRKDEFLATLAHELRNPLAPIRNSLQILKMPRIDAATAQQTREMMERQVHHLVRLVDDLLDVSRVMRGKIELRHEPVELAIVVARAVETTQTLIEAQGHELIIDLADESLLLNADPVRMTQVIGNLLTNAAKYTEAHGHIWLTARRDGTQVDLRVRDSGIGIDPEMLPLVFDLFVQVDHAASRSQGGLGIGLTLVKNLVEMHHGSVEAHSKGLGQGCEFVIRLPLATKHSQSSGESDTQQPPPSNHSGHSLLVVDDNRDAADSLAMLLRIKGHNVRTAYDGASALALASDSPADMVFLDIGMPGMDGYEVARKIRQSAGMKRVVLVALTGWGQQEDRRRTKEAGFDYHLVKPPEPEMLESLLAELSNREHHEPHQARKT